MPDTKDFTADEELLYFDIPVVVLLRRADEAWLANAVEWKGPLLQLKATRISELEITLLRENRLSLFAVCEKRPWREVFLDGDGYRWGDASGDELLGDDLADPGTGLNLALENVPDSLPPLTEHEVLYEFDGPMIAVLSDGAALWFANCFADGPKERQYMAARVSEPEVAAIKAGTLSVRAAYTDRAWLEVVSDGSGYRFGRLAGSSYPERTAPLPGIGIRPGLKNLPDRLSELCGSPEPN